MNCKKPVCVGTAQHVSVCCTHDYLKISCVSLFPDGCDKVVCRNNGTCMVDQYKRAYCVHSCDSLCSKRAKKDGPLCGADGVQYESSCHLRKETCKQGKTIGMAYRGKCIGE